MIAYHGSTVEVPCPDVEHSIRNLDFGKGFYVYRGVRGGVEQWSTSKF